MKRKRFASPDGWFWQDDVKLNGIFDFDYCFCNSDCKNTKCGRNKYSKSYAAMLRHCYNGIHSESDFSSKCSNYITEVK